MQFAAVSRGQLERAGRTGAEELVPADQIDIHVGQRLRARRTELGVSQGRLGRQIGLTFSQVQKYEKGSNRIGAGRLYHLAAILGVSVQYFFEGLEGRGLEIETEHQIAAAADAARMQDLFARITDSNTRQALLSLASSMTST